MGISETFDVPFYEGTGGTSTLVPLPYDVAIGGRPYVVSWEFTPFRREAYRHISMEITRTQADTDGVPGEHTLNPDGLWRRSQQSWGHGAAQTYLDRSTSDPERFGASKGVDVWTPYQFSVLNGVTRNYLSAGTHMQLSTSGSYLWMLDGSTLNYTSTPFTTPTVTWSGTNVLPAAGNSIATDGYATYVTCGTSGLYYTTDGTPGTPAAYVTSALGAAAVVDYALGRLMIGDGQKVYNVTAAGNPLPAPLWTQGNPGWNWVGFAEGLGFIYAAGTAGSLSQIYKITVQPDGTSLTPGSVAVSLPKGETVTAIQGYLGLILIGTSLGVRVASADSSGNLTLGSLITTPNPVVCFETQGRFAWFGYSNYDTVSTGLGRIDLSTLGALSNAPGTPAHASDLMFTGQGAVTSVASFNNLRVFAAADLGLIVENTSVLPDQPCVLRTGLITYDMSDLKYGVFVDVLPVNAGQVSVALSCDSEPFVACGTLLSPESLLQFTVPQTPCNTLEVQYTLASSNTPTVGALGLHRTTLRSMIATRTATQFKVPIRLSAHELVGDMSAPFVPSQELSFLDDLRRNRTITTFQESANSWAVTVDALDWTPDRRAELMTMEEAGVCVCTLTTIS